MGDHVFAWSAYRAGCFQIWCSCGWATEVLEHEHLARKQAAVHLNGVG